jgi:predicted acylesterase/phospholipase RssA
MTQLNYIIVKYFNLNYTTEKGGEMSPNQDNEFKIGITMAGAISAGAYTAGVMDYLIETLDKWEKAKKNNDPSVPKHNVVIEVLSGASAGGMTAALAAVALQRKFPHITDEIRGNEKNKKYGTRENILYDTWVNMGDNDLIKKMLDTSDLKSKTGPISILNSSFLRTIASTAICQQKGERRDRPNYISDNLDLFVTICDLFGTKYNIKFKVDKRHEMHLHHDIVHFVLNETGKSSNARIPLKWKGKNDSEDTNDTGEENAEKGKKYENYDLLKDSAIATGAFPLAFAPKEIQKEKIEVKDNPIFNFTEHKNFDIVGTENSGKKQKHLCIDGGLINNEPFGLTRRVLKKKECEKSIVIMIDPFPNQTTEKKETKGAINLKKIVELIFNSVKGQLRFNLDDVKEALSADNEEIYMIAPSSKSQRSEPLASGRLGGFSGFFHKEFRKKDFFLGRNNCRSFLRKYFVVSQANHPGLWTPEAIKRFEWEGAKGYFPIIPDMDVKDGQVEDINKTGEYEMNPSYETKKLKSYKKKIRKRIRKLVFALAKGYKKEEEADGESTILRKLGKKIHRIFLSFILLLLYGLLYFLMRYGVNKLIEYLEEELKKISPKDKQPNSV